ncbi:transposase [Corallococcus sp. CA047B]|uniref:transposase n=1 Tax=Corallococcus sp. CA047B TaxID=2316729 RepID=UPI000EA19C13|nr:transposase [Corallococcus sp. CA047B]
MRRHELSDAEWSRIEPLLGSRSGPPPKRRARNFIKAVIWRVTTGQRRALPEKFGHWKSVYNCFHRWAKIGCWIGFATGWSASSTTLRLYRAAGTIRAMLPRLGTFRVSQRFSDAGMLHMRPALPRSSLALLKRRDHATPSLRRTPTLPFGVRHVGTEPKRARVPEPEDRQPPASSKAAVD